MSEMRIGSLFSGVLSAASISDSNAPATTSPSSARQMSGAAASSPPTGPESPATPTSAPSEPQTFDWQMSGVKDTSWNGKARSWIEDKPGTARALNSSKVLAVWLPDPSTSSVAASRAKTSASPDAEPDSSTKEDDPTSSSSARGSQMSFYDPEGGSSLRTYPDSFPVTVAEISESFSRRWPTSGSMTSPGECWTHDSSESPSGGGVSSSLRDVLEEAVPEKYFLSPRAAAGILRRAEKRGRELPAHLLAALRAVSTTPASGEDKS